MNAPAPLSDDLIAFDVGNSRVKAGLFRPSAGCEKAPASPLAIAPPSLPEPTDAIVSTADELAAGALAEWLGRLAEAGASLRRLALASVCPPADAAIEQAAREWAEDQRVTLDLMRLASERLPITLRVDRPERVGVDRVAAAVAANRLRRPDTPAIVVDLGTAITVDLIAADGAFEGGAILPGPALSARALAEATAGLPPIRLEELDTAPDAVGRSTESAIEAGLFWGAVGAIRELIARQRDRLTTSPQVLLTGGAAPSVARLIGGPDYTVRHVPHLTLSGVALAASEDEHNAT